ncbi:MAG: hypothetical protein KA715_06300 [Xanthomonadaceae bacterium]|nr:hypothetical protein [Xanthomonadaceae bacterium]
MKLKSLLAVVALVVSANAQAAGEWRTGVAGGTNSTFSFTPSTVASWGLGINADYGHELSKNIQLVGMGSLSVNNALSTTVTGYSIGAGLRYNFGDKIQESMFIQAAIMYSATGVAGTTGSVGWKAGIGNRYKISDTIAYTPEVGVGNQYASTFVTIYANLVNFSIWF